MSICICENCDETTAEERPRKLRGTLLLSQLYCQSHLFEAVSQIEASTYQEVREDGQ